MDFWESLIPLFAIGFSMTAIVIIAVAIIFAGIRRRKMEIDAYKLAIEKGLDVPEIKVSKSPVSTLKAAMIWIAVGLGFGFIMIADGDGSGLAVASIPILIGIALIISYVIEKREREKEQALKELPN
ncbi:MAG: DUF6249 domain-containing protein [Acidihalobacter sp.]